MTRPAVGLARRLALGARLAPVHRQTQIAVASAAGAWDALVSARAPLVSAGAVCVDGAAPGFHEGLLARDPDGHVREVTER